MSDAAADCAAATNLRVGDVIRGFLENRHPLGDHLVCLQSTLARKRADGNTAIAWPNVIELFDPVDVDDDIGSRQPHVQKRHQALAAGENLAVSLMCVEKRQRLLETPRIVIVKFCRLHFKSGTLARFSRGIYSNRRIFSARRNATLHALKELSH